MRILVSGSRSWSRPDVVAECLTILARAVATAGDTVFVVVHGAAPLGADAQADAWVRTAEHPWELQVTAERHPANWREHHKAAGFKRNAEMVRLGADLALFFWRDASPGTGHTLRLAEEAGIPTWVVNFATLPELAEVNHA